MNCTPKGMAKYFQISAYMLLYCSGTSYKEGQVNSMKIGSNISVIIVLKY